jgi:hypothetical protein
MKLKLGDQISAHFEVEMPEYDYIDSTNPPSVQLMVTLICRHLDSTEGLEVYNKFMDMTINPDQLEFMFCNDVKEHQFKAFLHSSEPIGMGDWDICAKFGLVGRLTFKPDSIILPF